MKPVITFLLLLSFLWQQAQAQTTYQTQIPRNTSNTPYSVYPAQDGGTFVFGERSDLCTYSDGCNFLIYVYHFDARGKRVWAKDFSVEFSLALPAAIVTKDGGFAFLGRLYDTTTKTWKGGLLVKCNSDGNIVWSKQIHSRKYTAFEPKGIREDNDGNFLLFYTVANDMYDSDELQIVKLNKKGAIIWSQTGRLSGDYSTDIYEGVSFQQIGNRYYIFGGNLCQVCNEGVLTANVLVLDTGGTVVRCSNITAHEFVASSTTASRLLVKDNQTYLLGTYDYYSYQYFLTPITDTTTLSAGILFPADPFSLQYQLRNFENVYPLEAPSGYFDEKKTLTQLTSTKGTLSDILFHYDSLNRVCPDYKRPKVDITTQKKSFDITADHFTTTPDSVYLTNKTVQVSVNMRNYTLLCEGDASGNRMTNDISSPTSIARKVSVYPNPVRDVLHINDLPQSAVAVILSPAGAVIKKSPVSFSNPVIPVSDLKTGIYFLRIIQNGSEVYVGLFIKQ